MNKIVFLLAICVTTVYCQCWKRSFSRGVGGVVNACGTTKLGLALEKSGALCYDKCKNDFVGVGPVCWSKCSEGYADHGAICWKNTHIYGKGCCCTIFTPECCGNCPKDYTDDGCTCRRDVKSYVKKSYGRGVGSPMGCSSDQEYHAGLCYKKCGKEYSGIGPICYQKCKAPNSYDCGGFCAKDAISCSKSILFMINEGISIAKGSINVYGSYPVTGQFNTISSALAHTIDDIDLVSRFNYGVATYLFDLCPTQDELTYAAKAQAAKAAAQQQAQASSIAATVIAQLQAAGLISKQVSQRIQQINETIMGEPQQSLASPINLPTTTKAAVTKPMCRIPSDLRRRKERFQKRASLHP